MNRKPDTRSRRNHRRRRRINPDVLHIAKYAVLTLAGIWLYRVGSDYAFQQRGYRALGGEVFALMLPYLYWVASRTIRDAIVSAKKLYNEMHR